MFTLVVTLALILVGAYGQGDSSFKRQSLTDFEKGIEQDSDVTGSEQHVQLILPIKESLGIKGQKNVKAWQPYPIWKTLREDLDIGVPETTGKPTSGTDRGGGGEAKTYSPVERTPTTSLSVEEKTEIYQIQGEVVNVSSRSDDEVSTFTSHLSNTSTESHLPRLPGQTPPDDSQIPSQSTTDGSHTIAHFELRPHISQQQRESLTPKSTESPNNQIQSHSEDKSTTAGSQLTHEHQDIAHFEFRPHITKEQKESLTPKSTEIPNGQIQSHSEDKSTTDGSHSVAHFELRPDISKEQKESLTPKSTEGPNGQIQSQEEDKFTTAGSHTTHEHQDIAHFEFRPHITEEQEESLTPKSVESSNSQIQSQSGEQSTSAGSHTRHEHQDITHFEFRPHISKEERESPTGKTLGAEKERRLTQDVGVSRRERERGDSRHEETVTLLSEHNGNKHPSQQVQTVTSSDKPAGVPRSASSSSSTSSRAPADNETVNTNSSGKTRGHGYEVYETTDPVMQTVRNLFLETSSKPSTGSRADEDCTSSSGTTRRTEVHEVFHSTVVIKPCERTLLPSVLPPHPRTDTDQHVRDEQQVDNNQSDHRTSDHRLESTSELLGLNREEPIESQLEEQRILAALEQLDLQEDVQQKHIDLQFAEAVGQQKLDLGLDRIKQENLTKEEATLKPVVNIVTEISVQWSNNHTSENSGEQKSDEGTIFSKAGKAITDYLAKPWQLVASVFNR